MLRKDDARSLPLSFAVKDMIGPRCSITGKPGLRCHKVPVGAMHCGLTATISRAVYTLPWQQLHGKPCFRRSKRLTKLTAHDAKLPASGWRIVAGANSQYALEYSTPSVHSRKG